MYSEYLRDFGLLKSAGQPEDAILDVVREFYANAMESTHSTSEVRGVLISSMQMPLICIWTFRKGCKMSTPVMSQHYTLIMMSWSMSLMN